MPRKHSPCIINLDSLKNTGTHWVWCVPSHDNKFIRPQGGRQESWIWYFDSFGMCYPEEFTSDGIFSSSMVVQKRLL